MADTGPHLVVVAIPHLAHHLDTGPHLVAVAIPHFVPHLAVAVPRLAAMPHLVAARHLAADLVRALTAFLDADLPATP